MADPPPSVLTLLVKKGPCEGRTLQRRAGALRVGRVARGNDLSVRDAGASQRHLSVEFLPPPAARWAVTDLGSSNGTLLNGTPLVPTVPAPLSDGDLVKIGESTVIAVSISIDAGGPGPIPAAARRSARNAAPVAAAAAEEEEEQGPVVSRRAGRRKAGAAGAPEAGNEVEEEAVLPTRRGGGRKKAVEPAGVEMEAEKEKEAAIPRRGRSRKAAATVLLPPQPQNTRSTRAAARRCEPVGYHIDEEMVVSSGRGRGRVTRATARNGTSGSPEEEEQGDVAVARDRGGAAAESRGDEEEDVVETTDRTSNASEVVPAARRGRAKPSRRGRGRGTRAITRKAEDPNVENDENEQGLRDMADVRERVGSPLRVLAVNDGSGEDKVATEDNKLDGISKVSVEGEKMVDVEEDAILTDRATEGRVDDQHAPADNGGVEEEEVKNLSKGEEIEVGQELREKVSPESKMECVGEVEENDKGPIGASGEKGHSGERTGRRPLEDMTLGEWFVQIEKFLLVKNKEAAEKAIAEVQEQHWRFCEHVKTLKKSPAP